MTNKEILQELKKFQLTGTKDEIFKIHKYLLSWINKVAPLLKYNTQHYNRFMNAAQIVSIRGISSCTAMPCLDILKSTVNQAIIELENDITETKPAQQTIKKEKTNKSTEWHNKPLGKIIIGVIIALIVLAITLITKHFIE